MSTSQRDNRSSENSESTEFESDIETGAPNPNLNASQFETENGEQPNILTFNAPQKQMFSSESDSVSEHEVSSKENEERPDTNWNLFEDSSDDDDIQSYMKKIEVQKKPPKFRPLANFKRSKHIEEMDEEELKLKAETFSADPNTYSWNQQLKFWASNSELLHSKMKNSKELLQYLVKTYPEKADSKPDAEIQEIVDTVRANIFATPTLELEEALHKIQFVQRKDCEVPSQIQLPKEEPLADGEFFVKAVHGMRIGPKSGQIEWLTEFEAEDNCVYWILNSESLNMNWEVNAFLDRHRNKPKFPQIEDSFLQKCVQDYIRYRNAQKLTKKIQDPPSEKSSPSESSEDDDDDPEWIQEMKKNEKGRRIWRW